MLIIIGPMVKAMVWLREKLLREEPPRWNSLPEISFNMFRCILIQDIRIHSSIQAYRFIFIGWFFYSLLMISLYADVMIAHLAVPSFEKPIDSLYDLLGALKHRGFYTVLGCGSNNEFIYSSTDMKIYQDIWELFDRDEGCIKTWDEGMAKVLSGKYAFSNNRMGAEVRAYKLGRDKFHFAEHEFYAHGYSIACPNGSPYRNVFEEVLVYLMSCGLVHKYVRDEMERAVEFVGDANKGLEPIGIKHLQAAFYLVLVGNVLAFTVLMIEMMKKPNAVNDLP
ncbi:hypothetical protein SK128_013577 [Halocaridina rubra]|uniref:Ionotropic glutamate receptor C-terminal domain-containing protein n=1 Tax=Halocaridina rubra TaxID=373956 RepID=A0AAN8ZYV8_HALRR